MMQRIIWAALLAMGVSDAAMACGVSAETALSKDEVVRLTNEQLHRSDSIIDAVVYRDRRGEPSLKPLKIWKGKRQKVYKVYGDGCGIFLPGDGEKVRVVLYRQGDGWDIAQPIIRFARGMPKYEALVDAYLRNRRPKAFKSYLPVFLPPPRCASATASATFASIG